MANFTDREASRPPEHEINREHSVNSALFFWLAHKAEFAIRDGQGNYRIGVAFNEHRQFRELLTSPESQRQLDEMNLGNRPHFAVLEKLSKHIEVAYVKDSQSLELIFSPAAMLALTALKPLLKCDAAPRTDDVEINTTFAVLPNLTIIEIVGNRHYFLSKKADTVNDPNILTFASSMKQGSNQHARLSMFELLSQTIDNTDIFLKELRLELNNEKNIVEVLKGRGSFGFSSAADNVVPSRIWEILKGIQLSYLKDVTSPTGERLKIEEDKDEKERRTYILVISTIAASILSTVFLLEGEDPVLYGTVALQLYAAMLTVFLAKNRVNKAETVVREINKILEHIAADIRIVE